MARNNKHSKAEKLLLEYRPNLWRKSLLETVPEISQEALRACEEQISFTQALVDILRNSGSTGEKQYQVIHAAYMTGRQLGDVDEILDYIAENHEPLPRRTYFRLKGLAIDMLDNHLEGLLKEGTKK